MKNSLWIFLKNSLGVTGQSLRMTSIITNDTWRYSAVRWILSQAFMANCYCPLFLPSLIYTERRPRSKSIRHNKYILQLLMECNILYMYVREYYSNADWRLTKCVFLPWMKAPFEIPWTVKVAMNTAMPTKNTPKYCGRFCWCECRQTKIKPVCFFN